MQTCLRWSSLAGSLTGMSSALVKHLPFLMCLKLPHEQHAISNSKGQVLGRLGSPELRVLDCTWYMPGSGMPRVVFLARAPRCLLLNAC